jgi:acetylornithine/succinyldiaminopimelate/putrescine aminotransferase
LSKDEVIVKIAFAESIARIAEAAKRFLDTSHMMSLNKAISEAGGAADSAASSSSSSDTVNSTGSSNTTATTTGTNTSTATATAAAAAASVLVEFEYDAKLKHLHESVSRWIRELALDVSGVDSRRGSGLASYGSIVKRTLLVDLMRLCTFFGQESTMDMLLTQLLTFLSDQVSSSLWQ